HDHGEADADAGIGRLHVSTVRTHRSAARLRFPPSLAIGLVTILPGRSSSSRGPTGGQRLPPALRPNCQPWVERYRGRPAGRPPGHVQAVHPPRWWWRSPFRHYFLVPDAALNAPSLSLDSVAVPEMVLKVVLEEYTIVSDDSARPCTMMVSPAME